MLDKFIKACKDEPDIKAFAVFDSNKVKFINSEHGSSFHTTFVAIQLLAEKIGESLGAEKLLNAKFIGSSDQYFFLSLSDVGYDIYGVFGSNPQTDLDNLVLSIQDNSSQPENISESFPTQTTSETKPYLSGPRS